MKVEKRKRKGGPPRRRPKDGASKAKAPAPKKDEVKQLSAEEIEAARVARVEKNKTKTNKLAAKKKSRKDQERKDLDAKLRNSPGEALWEIYRAWAGERLTDAEADAERPHWVNAISSVDNERKLSNVVAPHLEHKEAEEKHTVPGVRALVVAGSALSAAHLAPQVYCGAPVGKLFSKHIKPAVQAQWLRKGARLESALNGAVPSAVATAKRLSVLCDADHLALDRTRVVVVDCVRDPASRNSLLEMRTQREELCTLLHEYVRPHVVRDYVKVVLRVPQEEVAEKAQE